MLHDPVRHEALQRIDWDPGRVHDAIGRIVADTEQRYSPDRCWPDHPRDVESDEAPAVPTTPLYHGACGVIWALHYLEGVGAVRLQRSYVDAVEPLRLRNRAWLAAAGSGAEEASYLMGDTSIVLLGHALRPDFAAADRLAALIEANRDHPARELMWGAPGTLLAASFLHEQTGDGRWATLFRDTASRLWSQLEWSPVHGCACWTQDLYGQRTRYLDAVHGFVATALPLIRGRALLDAADWEAWQRCIVETVERTATWEGEGDRMRANWRVFLDLRDGRPAPMLMQFCHGAPGFVVCLANMPGTALDRLLVAAGEAVWAAGPLTKGANLCHGTGGNGFAFLKLYRRTGDAIWLERARAFAMHGIAQMQAEARRVGRLRYSLWTGDAGLAVYLWHCLQGTADFPTLDVYAIGSAGDGG